MGRVSGGFGGVGRRPYLIAGRPGYRKNPTLGGINTVRPSGCAKEIYLYASVTLVANDRILF